MPDPHLTSIISFSVLNNLMKHIKICPYLYDVSDLAQDRMGVESGRIKFFQSSEPVLLTTMMVLSVCEAEK